jgi:hypothetical protein
MPNHPPPLLLRRRGRRHLAPSDRLALKFGRYSKCQQLSPDSTGTDSEPMSENVSSRILFHFTNSMENLKSILANGFFPHYCPEYSLDPADQDAAYHRRHPMNAIALVSFCDLPVSLIPNHVRAYGDFGIGLNKSWGVRHGVTPVSYTHRRAQTRKPVARLVAKARRSGDMATADGLRLLAAYSKPFRGFAWRGNRRSKARVHFYDEREWRHVSCVLNVAPVFLRWEDYRNSSRLAKFHAQLRKHCALPIGPDDIQYLLVPKDRYIPELHRFLMHLYGSRDGILVTTAIMTVDRIQEDI